MTEERLAEAEARLVEPRRTIRTALPPNEGWFRDTKVSDVDFYLCELERDLDAMVEMSLEGTDLGGVSNSVFRLRDEFLKPLLQDHRAAIAALRRVRHVLGMMERSDSESAGWWEQQLRKALDGQ